MLRDLYRSLIAFLALTVICGAAYPVVVWGVAQVAFGDAANGSLIERDGVVIGSARMGQAFAGAEWFQGRPSAYAYSGAPAGEEPVVAASGGSNLGPNAQAQADAVGAALAARAELEGVAPAAVPVDLVTSSASGVDPDISVAAALLQVPRVARERGLDESLVRDLVNDHVISSSLGFLGSERVNVLRLNLALQDAGDLSIEFMSTVWSEHRERAIGLTVFAALLVAEVATLLPFRDDLAAGTIALLLLIPVLAATWAGKVASLAAAIASALAFNFFFTEPYTSLRIEHDESVAAFAVYVLVAAVAALVVSQARTARRLADRRAAFAALLGDLSAQVMHSSRLEPPLRSALHELVRVLPLQGVAIRVELPDGVFTATAGDAQIASETAELLLRPTGARPAVVSLRHRKGTVASVIATPEEVFGFLVADAGGEDLDRDRQSVVDSFAGIVALAAARARLEEEGVRRRALEETDRLRGALVQSVSHDLRTPLTAIRTAAGALRQTDDPALRAELLSDIEQHADRLTRLVTDMLDLSRVESGALRPKLTRMPVDELVWGAVEAAVLPDEKRVDVRVADGLPPIDVDETMMRQVVVNLLRNAAAHSDGSRAVEVEALRTLSGRVELRVVDHGPGIPEAERRRVFEPYLRLRPEGSRPVGSGLGLAIGRGFVEAHGGTIRVETTPGGGATFVVSLPRGQHA